MSLSGEVRKLGDNIDTDVIIPAHYLTSRDPVVLGPHCMEPLDPDFAGRVSQGDIIVAGDNFGCGSSREHAIIALQGAGISAVIARSFSRIFSRNAINCGLPIAVCPDAVDQAQEGSPIAFDFAAGHVMLGGIEHPVEPLPDFLRQIVDAGGLMPFTRQLLG